MKSAGYDLDNVITKTQKFAVDLVNKNTGTSHTVDDCNYPSVEECFGLDRADVDEWFFEEFNTMHLRLEPIEGSKEVINKYHNVYDQHIISARSSSALENSLAWFGNRGYKIKDSNVHLVKQRGRTSEEIAYDKIEIAKNLGLKLFVEDSLTTANLMSKILGIPVCFFEYKFNKGETQGLVIPVEASKGWKKVDELLENL